MTWVTVGLALWWIVRTTIKVVWRMVLLAVALAVWGQYRAARSAAWWAPRLR